MYKFILLFVLTLSFSFSKSINFEEILDLSLKNNKDLKQEKYNIEASKLNIEEVSAYSYGKLSLSEEVSRSNHAGYVFNYKLSSREASFKDFGFSQMNEGLNTKPEDLNNPKSRNNFTTKLSYDLPLFTGFKLKNQKEILSLQKKANQLKLNLSQKELSYELLKAYNGAVVAKNLIKTMKQAKKLMQTLVFSANSFHKEGLVTKIDVKQAKVQELNVNSKLHEAQNKYSLALAYLNFLSSSEDIDDVKDMKIFDYSNSNQDSLYKTALANRDEVKMQSINNKAMKKNIDISNSSYYPTVYSHLEYGFNDDKLTLDSKKDYYMAMLGLKYDIFDNTRSSKKQKSKIEYQKSKLNYEKLKDGIKLQIKKSLLNLSAKEKILKEKKAAKQLSKEVFEQSKLMYKNHLISMTDLLKQESSLRENKTNYLLAKFEKSIAIAQLKLSLGENFKKDKN